MFCQLRIIICRVLACFAPSGRWVRSRPPPLHRSSKQGMFPLSPTSSTFGSSLPRTHAVVNNSNPHKEGLIKVFTSTTRSPSSRKKGSCFSPPSPQLIWRSPDMHGYSSEKGFMKSFQKSEVKMLHYSLRLLEFLKRFDFWTYSTSNITNFLFHLLISQVVFYFVDSYMQWHCNNALLI